jgi:hypothetical protein
VIFVKEVALMIRTPLYTAVQPAQLERRIEEADEPAREPTRDDYITKLLKYVPAEVTVAFTALVAAAAQADQATGGTTRNQTIVWIAFFIGLVATAGYFYRSAYKLPPDDKPRPYFYVLVLVSFVIWSLAVNESVRQIFNNMDERMAEFLLVAGAFLIPFVDEMLTMLYPRFQNLFRR